MAELDIAKSDMYGYRETGPNEPATRVRVVAGTPIPPDLINLEGTDEIAEGQYPETVAAHASAEDQEKAQKERNESTQGGAQYNPDQPEDRGQRAAVPQGAVDQDDRPDTSNEETGRSGGRRSRKS